MTDWLRDVRYGTRVLLRSPGFAVVAVLSLALGIGVNTAVLSVGRSVLLEPLRVDEPDRLVVVNWVRKDNGRNPIQINSGGGRDAATGRSLNTNFSMPLYRALREAASGSAEAFAFTFLRQANVALGDQAVAAGGMLASGNYFRAMRVPIHLGRGLQELDDRVDAEPVAVLGHAFWQRAFGADPSAVGRGLRINGRPFIIVGVTAPGYFGVSNGGFFTPTDVTMTLAAHLAVRPQWAAQFGSLAESREVLWLRVMARLRSPEDEPRAAQAMTVALARDFADSGVPQLPQAESPEIRLLPGARGLDSMRASMETPLYILTAVAGLVLLIACANVAGLLVARSAARRQELWLRRALGAGRGRLVRQAAIESLLLAGAGGVLGVMFAILSGRALVQMLAGSGSAIDVALDARLLLIAFGVSLAAGLLFGTLPALRVIGRDTAESIRQTGAGAVGLRQRAARALVVVQVAIAVPLLVGALLFLRTVHNLAGVDLGFDARGLVMFRLDPALNGYDAARTNQLYQRVLDRLADVPGVRSATLIENSLISGWVSNTSATAEGRPTGRLLINRVGPGFFDTMGLTLAAGRALGLQDREGSTRVGVLNEKAVQQFFGGGNPIGRQLRLESKMFGEPVIEIVGVVRDSKYESLKTDVRPTLFMPHAQNPTPGAMHVTVRVAAGPSAAGLPERLRAAVAEVDRDVAVTEMKTQAQQIDQTIGRERAFTILLVAFGGFAVLLACLGLHGITSYAAARRTSEIGIRMALGARRADVVWLILRQVVFLAAGGLLIGIPAAALASRAVRAFLFGVEPADPVTLAAGGALLFVVALAAGYLPARRAARLDPLVALRRE